MQLSLPKHPGYHQESAILGSHVKSVRGAGRVWSGDVIWICYVYEGWLLGKGGALLLGGNWTSWK